MGKIFPSYVCPQIIYLKGCNLFVGVYLWYPTRSEALVLFMCLDAKKFVLLSFTSLIKTVKCESFNQTTAQGCNKSSSG